MRDLKFHAYGVGAPGLHHFALRAPGRIAGTARCFL
jgi:hypothetical protein